MAKAAPAERADPAPKADLVKKVAPMESVALEEKEDPAPKAVAGERRPRWRRS